MTLTKQQQQLQLERKDFLSRIGVALFLWHASDDDYGGLVYCWAKVKLTHQCCYF